MRRLLPMVIAALLPASCITVYDSPTAGRVDSITLELLDPTELGTPQDPIATRSATFNLTAKDDQGNLVEEDVDVDLYLASGGIRTGALVGCSVKEASKHPLATVHLQGGKLENYFLDLPSAFGASAVWADVPSAGAAGASPVIQFRNPFVSDITTPPDIMAPTAAYCNPLTGKFVRVDRASGTGRLVVSAVFTNAFVMVDTGTNAFNAIYVFTFSRPSGAIVRGRPLDWVTGNIAKFNGYTQLAFPRVQASDDSPDLSLLPAPVPLANKDLTNVPKMLGLVSRTVEVTGKICDPFPANPTNNPDVQKQRDSWLSFNQFVVDADTTCNGFSNYTIALPAKKVGDFDPTMHVGETATFRGVLRNASGQNFRKDADGNNITCSDAQPCAQGMCQDGFCMNAPYNFWTVFPSSVDDID